jgi:hypothetical protein
LILLLVQVAWCVVDLLTFLLGSRRVYSISVPLSPCSFNAVSLFRVMNQAISRDVVLPACTTVEIEVLDRGDVCPRRL